MFSPDPLPRTFGGIFAEQVRAVGLAAAREIALAGAALVLICALTLLMAIRYDEQLVLVPEILQSTLLLAPLFPFAVWKGDPVFGRAVLWTLPVHRQHAALAKIFAGALWLMLAMLVSFAALSLVSVASGGSIGTRVTWLVDSGTGDIRTASRVAWTTPFWMWLMPFASALLLYLASRAAILGLRHPIRWLAGIAAAATMLFVTLVTIAPDGAVEHGVERFRQTLWSGSFGLDFVFNGGATTLARTIDRPGPGSDILWTALPDAGRWAWATLVWLGLALLAVALAIRRHWER